MSSSRPADGGRPRPRWLIGDRLPSGIMGVPVEAIETAAPLLMHRRELRPDSGGPGRYRGGLGQVMELEIITGAPPITPACMTGRAIRCGFAWWRSRRPPAEVRLSDGSRPHPKSHYVLQPANASSYRCRAAAATAPRLSVRRRKCWRKCSRDISLLTRLKRTTLFSSMPLP